MTNRAFLGSTALYKKVWDTARRELGVTEIPGEEHNPRVIEYHAATKHRNPTDEAPWCSAFLCWVFTQCGLRNPASSIAGDWLNWGVSIEHPVRGCIMLIDRGEGRYHVTLFDRWNEKYAFGMGGNQGNSVCTSAFPIARVKAFRGFP